MNNQKSFDEFFLKSIQREHLLNEISKLLSNYGLTATESETLLNKIGTYLISVKK